MKKLTALLLSVMVLFSLGSLASAEETTTIGWTSWALAEENLIPIYAGSADAFMAENPDITIDYSQTNPYASSFWISCRQWETNSISPPVKIRCRGKIFRASPRCSL